MDNMASLQISEDRKSDFLFELHLRRMQEFIFSENNIDKNLKRFTPISFSIRNEQNNIVGGIYGWLSYDFAYIEAVWVDTAIRRSSMGRRLIENFELKAKAEHCHKVLVTSNTYADVSGFWKKMGYDLVFELQGVSCNIQYFQKQF